MTLFVAGAAARICPEGGAGMRPLGGAAGMFALGDRAGGGGGSGAPPDAAIAATAGMFAFDDG